MSICANIYIDFEQWCQYINIFKRWWPLGDHLERVFLLLFHLRIRTVATEDSRGVSLWRQLGLHFLPSCWYGRSCQTRAPVIRRPPTADSESCQLVRTTSYVASPSPPEPWSWSLRLQILLSLPQLQPHDFKDIIVCGHLLLSHLRCRREVHWAAFSSDAGDEPRKAVDLWCQLRGPSKSRCDGQVIKTS